jgi:crotonobetainyl-CoA:carnitine CoA-transferase CaiB-like acyl-CoA transferase
MLANQGQNYLSGDGGLTPRMGNSHPNVSPYEVFKTQDGYIVLAVGTDHQYQKFCSTVEQPGLSSDPRFRTNQDRVRNRKELSPRVQAILATRSNESWLSIFGAVGVPCGPIHTLDEVYQLPQVQARKMVFQMEHPLAGKVPLTANPIHFHQAPIHYDLPPPLLGQHTREILSQWLDLTEADVERLSLGGAI